MLGDRLVAEADVLVDQHGPELARVHGAVNGLDLRHRIPPSVGGRLAPLGLVAQLRLEHLAGGVARERLVAQGDDLRHLEVGHALASRG